MQAAFSERVGALMRRRSGDIVFIGDSITHGLARQPFFRREPRFVDRGVSGETAQQILSRFAVDALATRPAIVHILAGTNDVAQNQGPRTIDEIARDLMSMVRLARAEGIVVLLGAVPPAADFPWRSGLCPAATIGALNQRIAGCTAPAGVAFVDYWSAMAAPDGRMRPELSRDGVHPDAAGYVVMQRVLAPALAAALRTAGHRSAPAGSA